jgi:NIPSNAP
MSVACVRAVSDDDTPILELRQYAMRPGRRDELIEIFERELIVPQEEMGAIVHGQFCDLDDPDRFVWLRGFASMRSRPDALTRFYTSDIWRRHRDAVNDTLVDSDDVLLLRPAQPGSGLARSQSRRSAADDGGLIVAAIHCNQGDAFPDLDEGSVAGGSFLGRYVTEPAPNNYPPLPVREGEDVAVWLAAFADRERGVRFAEAHPRRTGAVQVLKLAPTPRSALRAR